MNNATTSPFTSSQPEATHIQQTFAAQRDTAIRLRQSTTAERLTKIKKLKETLLAHADDVIAAGFADFGKPAAEVELTEILPVVAEANDAIRKLGGWMKPKKVWPSRMMLGTVGYTQYEPKGRVLIISPWNYPVNLTLGPLVSAIAAGNTVIIKTSEMTPHASAIIRKIVQEAFDETEVALFEGDATVAQALLELPFDHIFFTGSPAVGKVVMAAAAKNLTSVTLELGGKSPTIIDESADLELAAKNTLWAKFTNNGQTCIAPDHVYVHSAVKEAFIKQCVDTLNSVYGQDSNKIESPDLARIVNPRHVARVKALLDDATSRGARVITGGQYDENKRYIAPTLLEGIPDDAEIMSEEIFGPLLPIISFTQLDSVIARINADPKPLALYVWSRNKENIKKVMQQTTSGGACINHSVVQFLHGNLPFGGVNNSGIGSGHGYHGFLAFSHERAVVRSWIILAKMFYPPYSNLTRKLIALFIKTV
ncbi:MAG: aldehyde dehydrogenase family protein [Gammaproteobacteria bacterium]|nr:aldehyde dehydrogenase family protein [Gammaproteobacteria bacterium]